jgi:hypothetical protein
MATNSEADEAYRHTCPVLGENTIIPRALVANQGYVIYYQRKCVFCGALGGGKEYAKGVRPDTLGGYYIDTSVAEKLS